MLIFFLALVFAQSTSKYWHPQPVEEITYNRFLELAQAGELEKIELRKDNALITGTMRNGQRFKTTGPQDPELGRWLFENVPEGTEIEVKPRGAGEMWLSMLASLIPVLLVFGLIYLFLARQASMGSNQAFSFGRSRAKRFTDSMPRKTFDDVAGVDEAKQELAEVVDFLKNADKYKALGAEIPKGVLLMGPPGCGKTLLARAVAGEADVPFFHISGSDFVEMFVGVGASRVRDLFEQAKAARPCLVFIDELDAVGRHRGAGLGGGHDEREQTLNQLLVEMDGFEVNAGIIVLAATNRPDILDPALLRPGRFDRHIVVDNPDCKGRKAILELYVKSKPLDAGVDLDMLARQTVGFSGADLANLVNESALMAARKNKKKIDMEDFEEAFERVIAGPERKSRVLSETEKRIVAYHESGHALVGRMLPEADTVRKVTILPRGLALGYTMHLPSEERFLRTREQLMEELTSLLGGRAAEEMVFGDISTGAQNDLERVTEIARAMVCEYGMSETLGPRTLGRKHGPVFLGRDMVEDRNYSEEMAYAIDQEIRRIVDECHQRAQKILSEHRAVLDRLVEVLLEKETIDGEELDQLIFEMTGQWPPGARKEKAELLAEAKASSSTENSG
ncbi:MAG TPA: ATP-dependent metallopeptidase FtsH/Yme1/Tma family protein [Armatimonadetes bacterium]|nr:ATP-dependent metallopeptidase FtsH/Yme1/Tma family protein [Armatimonadota bacterium]